MSDPRLRLTILGGYLGAGKTSWLRHQRHAGQFANAILLINEVADTPVDTAVLGPGPIALPAGCACCTGLPAFLACLRRLADTAGPAPQPLLLETSGLADPARIVAAIQSDPVLPYHVALAETIVLVDALHGLQSLPDPLCRRQIEAADRLILTKTDAVPAAATARLHATLRRLNPGAAITAASLGVPVPLPGPTTPHDLAISTEAPATAQTIPLGNAPDWPALAVWLSALLHAHGETVLRVKGVISTPAGRLLLQSVRRAVQPPEPLPGPPAAQDDHLVIISRSLDPELVAASLFRTLRL